MLGLTGPNAAGKGEVAAILRERGFAVHSLSDIVREEAVARGRTTGRDDLIATGNALREAGGAGVLADRIVPRIGDRDVVDSIRNPAEVDVLRARLPSFFLIGVTAPVDVRFRRSLARGRVGDPTTREAFVEREKRENTGDPTAQRLDATFACADVVWVNDGDLDRLRGRVEAFLAESRDAPGPSGGPRTESSPEPSH